MAKLVCPWWIGYLMVSPLRRLTTNPYKLLAPYVSKGMTVLEPGPGMGFFTLPVAEMAGPDGRVIAVDVQRRMLDGLRRRAAKAGLFSRIDARLAAQESMGLEDLKAAVDVVLAIAVVHETPSVEAFFREAASALKPGGALLLIEPSGHVGRELWSHELEAARSAGLEVVGTPQVRRCRSKLLRKEG